MINPGVLADVAQKLNSLGLNYAFVGGSIVEFLLDNQGLSPVRPTDDLDIIVEVLTNRRYSDIEHTLRKVGFVHQFARLSTRTAAPRLRNRPSPPPPHKNSLSRRLQRNRSPPLRVLRRLRATTPFAAFPRFPFFPFRRPSAKARAQRPGIPNLSAK